MEEATTRDPDNYEDILDVELAPFVRKASASENNYTVPGERERERENMRIEEACTCISHVES